MKIIRLKRSGRPGQIKLSKMLNTGTNYADVLGGVTMLLDHYKVCALISNYYEPKPWTYLASRWLTSKHV